MQQQQQQQGVNIGKAWIPNPQQTIDIPKPNVKVRKELAENKTKAFFLFFFHSSSTTNTEQCDMNVRNVKMKH